MGLITRLYDFVDGEYAYADQVDAEINQILTELNGNIANSNISGTAGILGTKIAIAPNGIPENRHNDESVTTTKLGKKPSGAARANINLSAVGELELDYTNAKIPHMGVTGLTIARGRTGVMGLGNDEGSNYEVVFATDAIDGNPSFVEPPLIVLGIEVNGEAKVTNVLFYGPTLLATGFQGHVHIIGAGATVYGTWIAIGK